MSDRSESPAVLRTGSGVAGAGAGVLCSAAVPTRVSDAGISGRHGAGGHGARAVSGHVLQGKPTRLGEQHGRSVRGGVRCLWPWPLYGGGVHKRGALCTGGS